jgi:hypothetical protein
MDLWKLFESLRGFADDDRRDLVLAHCAATLLILVLVLIQFVRARRLKRQIDELQLSVRRLNGAEELRLMRDMHSQARSTTPD